MPHYQPPRRSAAPPSYPYGGYYPGINPFEASEIPLTAEASSLSPYAPTSGNSLTTLPAATDTAAGAASGFSLANIGGIVERLGGIDGIIATMGKVQKVMQTFQQFAPMAKMVAGFLPGGKGGSQSGNATGRLDEYKPQRRKARSTKSRKSTSGSRSRKTNGRRRR